jgi:hypothetical protein
MGILILTSKERSKFLYEQASSFGTSKLLRRGDANSETGDEEERSETKFTSSTVGQWAQSEVGATHISGSASNNRES